MKRTALWLASLSAAAVVGAEWMRVPGAILAAGVAIAALAAAWAAWSAAPAPAPIAWPGAAAALALAVATLAGTSAVGRVERDWRSVREEAVTGASRRLGGELDEAAELARTVARQAADAESLPPARAFGALERLVRRTGPSHGIVLFDTQGRPRAWAGLHRTALTAAGPELDVVTTPFYLWLVARRQTTSGVAVATVMLARGDEVPRVGTALTDRFVQRTGVGLRFFDPLVAPADRDVFYYVRPGAVRDTLFAVQPVPPEQSLAHRERLRAARRTVAVLMLAVLLLAGSGAVRSGSALGFLPAAAAFVAIARAPLAETFGALSVFSPDTYVQRLLGPFSSSAGTLLLAGVALFVLACALWHRGLPSTRTGRFVAVAGTLLAPYLIQSLARGILPPSGGVSTVLWATWQVALVIAASALVMLAAALVRGREPRAHAGPWPWVASAIALAAAVLGLWLWQPGSAWPPWYPYLWAPALLLALRPMPFRGTLATVAIVAGSSAALLTWGATTEGRMALAARDLESLGDASPSPSTLQLERLIRETAVDSAPRSQGELFVLWRRSSLGAQRYPASLAVWGPHGERILGLALADLDVPASFVSLVAHAATEQGLPQVQPVSLVPGVHAIAALPAKDGRVVTITVGPRSRLVASSRLARFLIGGRDEPEAPYQVALAPPSRVGAVLTARAAWHRDRWVLRGERTIALPGGPRHAHAEIDLRGPSPLLQRGALVLVLDVAALAVLWLLVEAASGRALPALRRWFPRARRSLRFRLSVSLALFFVVPTVASALWSLGRLEDEFRGARQLLLQRTLRDASRVLGPATGTGDSALVAVSQRVDAELQLSRGGVLWATSAPVMADLGLSDLLVPSEVYPRFAWEDEIELASEQRAVPVPTLVGYYLVERPEPGSAAVLASPEPLLDRDLQRREADLGIAVTVAGVLGSLAAILLSGLAARALARPLQELRQAALAVGSGEPPGRPSAPMPVELEPIHGALTQAAADVEAGRRAQRVLAWGEMARQIAHEIKNPLTPIRLGIQHLLRLVREKPDDLGATLPPTGERILAEIDRLDGIARAFSRFALPSGEGVPVEAVDVTMVVRDVVHLYKMGEAATLWEATAPDGMRALARRDELAEVLVNLCENARDAGARHVTIVARADEGAVVLEVRDDGRGIPAEVRPRIFEPNFRTTTSGSGLGLAIARRLVESWGGTIGLAPEAGPGTVVCLTLLAAS